MNYEDMCKSVMMTSAQEKVFKKLQMALADCKKLEYT